jgi:hypothetical protein
VLIDKISFFILIFFLISNCFAKDIPYIKKDIKPYKIQPEEQDIKIYGLNKKVYEIISNNKKEKSEA